MKKKKITKWVKTNLRNSWCTSGEKTSLDIIIDIEKGTSKIVITQTVSEEFEIQDLEKATDLYERLNCGAGRKAYKPSDLAHQFNPEKNERDEMIIINS